MLIIAIVFIAVMVFFGAFFVVKSMKSELNFNTSYEELSKKYEDMLNGITHETTTISTE